MSERRTGNIVVRKGFVKKTSFFFCQIRVISPRKAGKFSLNFWPRGFTLIGRTPKGAYSSRGHSRHLLETAFSEPLLRTVLRTLSYCKTHSRPPSPNPSENPFPRTLPRTFSEPLLERCVAVRPLRRAPNLSLVFARYVPNTFFATLNIF